MLASIKTEATELSVAFGLIGVAPETAYFEDVESRFEGTLSREKFDTFQHAYINDEKLNPLCTSLYEIAEATRNVCPDLFPEQANVRWYGPFHQSRTVTTPQDLVMAATAISVKENSMVVFNLSPYNLFISIPSGLVLASKTENWYSRTAPNEYQSLFELVNEKTGFSSVSEFDRRATKEVVKGLQTHIKHLDEAQTSQFGQQYVELCTHVSLASANIFNQTLEATLQTVHGTSLKDELLRYFLRLDAMPYVLIGLERNRPFSILVPSITQWKREWQLGEITAASDPSAGQSVVRFSLVVTRGRARTGTTLPFHAEIRWSHGKFGGNPEAKLYRDFAWRDVPGFRQIVGCIS